MLPEGYQWITDETERIQPGDLMRVRDDERSEYCEWRSADHYAGMEAGYFAAWHSRHIQFCRPVRPAVEPAPEQSPAPTIDRGNKYHRTITQTLQGESHGVPITVDVYDVLRAYGVRCGARQHAIKKLLCAGLRGNKDARQDLREAIEAIQRAIELCEVVE